MSFGEGVLALKFLLSHPCQERGGRQKGRGWHEDTLFSLNKLIYLLSWHHKEPGGGLHALTRPGPLRALARAAQRIRHAALPHGSCTGRADGAIGCSGS